MKSVLIFIAGFIIGAVVLYASLWYQVYLKWDKVWCQIYTGELSVEESEKCKRQ